MHANKIKLFFSNIKFKLSDLFLVIGFIPMIIYLITGQVFMQYPNPHDVGLSLPWIIVLFVVLLISWGIYLYLEFKEGNKVRNCVSLIFIVLAVVGIIGILIQPRNFVIDFISTDGDNVHVELEISITHYLFFIFDILSILFFIYISLFVLPKRFKTIIIIQFVGYFVFLLCFFVMIYSYIFESNNYVSIIKVLMEGDVDSIKYYSVKSCIINPNAYGMVMMLGMMFCYIHHAMHKRWWYFPLAIFFYINMFFSFCRVGLLISPILFLIYVYFVLISTYQQYKTRNKVFLVLISSILASTLLLAFVVYLSNGKILNKLYLLLTAFDAKGTIGLRERIWNNTNSLIAAGLPTTLFFGRGFGIINEILLQMNLNSGGLAFPTHNGYLNLLSEGGFVYLFAYVALLIYYGYIFVNCFNKQKALTLTFSFGAIAFTFYSLIETIHYLVYPFMFIMFILHNVLYQSTDKKSI